MTTPTTFVRYHNNQIIKVVDGRVTEQVYYKQEGGWIYRSQPDSEPLEMLQAANCQQQR